MASSFLSLLLSLLLFHSFAGAQALFQNCDPNAGNFSDNSTYRSNLERLLSIVGGDSDQVFGTVNCRGDNNTTECRSYLDIATAEVTRNCPNNRGAEVKKHSQTPNPRSNPFSSLICEGASENAHIALNNSIWNLQPVNKDLQAAENALLAGDPVA
ncbi:hypothetical protein ZIOFF_004564 [Zingiber officinale]|uniref:Gnk2-homologous domain-containing protein n=1 Tax=Zingiber officinale TaxID=94328 RepID=A0A8J5I937_ZINOF|nr:hypothetical protein ZIOFF_004564 [Zingiber officinale]